MKRWFDIFRLTRSEQRVVVVLLLVLVVAALLTKSREANKTPLRPLAAPSAMP